MVSRRSSLSNVPSCHNPLFGSSEPYLDELNNWGWSTAERIWPTPTATDISAAIPQAARRDIKDAQKCLSHGIYSAAAVLCGKALERLIKEKTGNHMIGKGIAELKAKAIIDERLFDWAEALRKERNIGAHASEEETEKTKENAQDIIDFPIAIFDYVATLYQRNTNDMWHVKKPLPSFGWTRLCAQRFPDPHLHLSKRASARATASVGPRSTTISPACKVVAPLASMLALPRRIAIASAPSSSNPSEAMRFSDCLGCFVDRHRKQAGLLLVVLGIADAVKIAAQRCVALVARGLHAMHHAPQRHTDHHQRVRGQHQAAFEGFRHYLGGAGLAQLVEIAVVVAAHDHRQRRRDFMREMQRLDGRLRVWRR